MKIPKVFKEFTQVTNLQLAPYQKEVKNKKSPTNKTLVGFFWMNRN
jgi:hypothetical protein